MRPSWCSAGVLNKQLSAAITAEGQPAVGICAADAACFSASPLVHNDVEGGLGYVGYLTSVNVRFLESLWRAKLLPVAACLGLGADNELYNINADHMAAACAEFVEADHLIYLTDVAGVLDGEKVLSAISCEEIDRLIHSRVVSGGMILKLEAAKRALQSGVREVHIVGGNSAAAALAPEPVCDGSRKNHVSRTSRHARVPGVFFRWAFRQRGSLVQGEIGEIDDYDDHASCCGNQRPPDRGGVESRGRPRSAASARRRSRRSRRVTLPRSAASTSR